jgi:hypothetical protein
VATGSAQEISEKIREGQLGREDRVLKDISTIRSDRRIVILACKHLKERGEGKG